jgi:Na+/melibiose symporter-like transporter
VAWREGLGLLGVVLASIAPALWGMPVTAGLFWMALLLGWLAWQQSARPQMLGNQPSALATGVLWLPFRRSAFRRLLGVFVLNGIASAVPATLVLFFIQDRLLASKAMEPVFLGTFFLCAALSMPLWLKAVARMGLAQAWLLGMLLSVLVFVWASQLQAGDVIPFLVICLLSGLALGADLALPGAMLARVIARAGDLGLAQGAYFGWWNFATKLNLAVAAGVALPVLGLFGYVAGAKDPKALFALTVAYCVLPCILKCLAALSLYLLVIRPARSQETDETS